MRQASRAIIIQDDKLLVTKRNKFGSEYHILIGGGVKHGETELAALYREVKEESGVEIANPRLVFTENAGMMYGLQYIFLCEYVSGEPVLDPTSAEAQISAMGKNTYEPVWLPLSELSTAIFRSPALQQAILDGVKNGFPDQAIDISKPVSSFFHKA